MKYIYNTHIEIARIYLKVGESVEFYKDIDNRLYACKVAQLRGGVRNIEPNLSFPTRDDVGARKLYTRVYEPHE